MNEIGYSTAELSKLKYVKVKYTGLDDKQHEIKTEVKMLGEALISVYFRDIGDFDIKYPQQVTVKFVTDAGMFIAKSILQSIKKSDNYVYFSIMPPARMIKHQDRKYYRICLKRHCVLICTDEEANSIAFMSKLVDVSAGGVLIHQLESMFNDDIVNINPENFKYFNIVLFLDIDTVLKLSARYVRQEKREDSYRYAFEFIRMKQKDTDTISKYVAKEQLGQMKLQQKHNE